MKNHQFTSPEDNISMMEYGNMFLGNTMWMNSGKGFEEATFDLVVREMPNPHWGFLLMFGLDRFLTYVENFTYSEKDIAILLKLGLIDPEHKRLYALFRFSGDVWAIEDGVPFFPNEPIVRVSGPLWQVNLLTALALNAFSYPVRVLTKGARVKIAAGTKKVAPGVNVARSQGFEQVAICQQAAYLTGDASSTQPNFYKEHPAFLSDHLYFQPNINHATIKSYTTEREAFRAAFREVLPGSTMLQVMIDTYDLKSGLKTFIEELTQLPKKEQKKIKIPIDSGDLRAMSFYIRKELDRHRLQHVGIMAYSNLEEYKIRKLESQNVPIEYYICITEVVNVSDAPVLDQVFKMSELKYPDGRIEYKAKLVKGKESYPGRKQIFRQWDRKGMMRKDVIGLENEKLGTPLLRRYLRCGKRVRACPNLKQARTRLQATLDTIPAAYKQTYATRRYPVTLSPRLRTLFSNVKRKHI